MTQTQQTIKHWSNWLDQFPGQVLLEAESQNLEGLLTTHTGRHAVLIGVPQQLALLQSSPTTHKFVVSPFFNKHSTHNLIEGSFQEIPILSGSVDLVLLPHILELVDNPRQLLAEACRIVRPEGVIAICGFNPYSFWGVRKILFHEKKNPWTNQFIPAGTVKKWLQLADFEMIKHASLIFRPPIFSHKIYPKLSWMESMGKKCYPGLGAVYIILARAKVIPLTPIRLHWKQEISGIRIRGSRISTGITGRVARDEE